jgi:hypothetical protein
MSRASSAFRSARSPADTKKQKMKTIAIISGVTALVVIGILVLSACSGQGCVDTSSFKFLLVHDEASGLARRQLEILSDPKFANMDAFGVSGFIDGRKECSNYKRAAQSLSLHENNVNNHRWENKTEAILIYREARRHGCNID